jgi:hypothetical protein
MTYLEITEKNSERTDARMRNDATMLDVPVTLIGRGASRFFTNKDGENVVSIHPDTINVFRKGEYLHSLINIKVSRLFNRTTIEGVDSRDGYSPSIIDSTHIHLMWADDYRYDNDIWNIEL